MDPITTPTVAPTGDPALVNSSTLAGNLVNPAQAPIQQQQQQYVPPVQQNQNQQQGPDVSGLIANYENRLRALQSIADKAVNERNASITSQAQMQAQLTTLQESATNGLSQAVDNAQRAINENAQLRAQVQALQGELVRFKVLAETPDLLPYAPYIPANSDESVVRQHAESFKTMREADLARFRPAGQQQQQGGYGYTPGVFPGVPPIPQFTSAVAPVPGGQPPATPVAGQPAPQPQQQQQGQGQPNVMNLYQNRPTMAPQYQGQPPMIPGSQPAMMSPAGAQSTPDSINAMLRSAMEQGPDAFNAALEQAKTLAVSYTNQQLGRV